MEMPPGLAGFLAAKQQANQDQSQKLQQMGLLSGMQNQDLQRQVTAQQLQDKTQRLGLLSQYAQQLPEDARAAFMVSPDTFIKERFSPYTLGPGQTRYVGGRPVVSSPAQFTLGPGQSRFAGNQTVASMPLSPTLTEVGVAGQPGVTQRGWVAPGSQDVTPVGAPKMPEILNPAVQAARANVAKAGASRTNVTVNPMRETFKDEQALREEYTKASSPFVKLSEGYVKVKGALSSDPAKSAPATLAAATQFMKMLDPESVVRESELGMALNAAGVWDRFTNIYNTVQHGGVLTPNQAAEFGRIADVVYQAANAQHQGRVEHFRGLAKSYNFNPDRVVPDLTPRRRSTDAAQPSASGTRPPLSSFKK